MAKCPSVVLTGGPSGGKATLMSEPRVEDLHAKRWIMVPNGAPFPFDAGLDGRRKDFHKAVVRLHLFWKMLVRRRLFQGKYLNRLKRSALGRFRGIWGS